MRRSRSADDTLGGSGSPSSSWHKRKEEETKRKRDSAIAKRVSMAAYGQQRRSMDGAYCGSGGTGRQGRHSRGSARDSVNVGGGSGHDAAPRWVKARDRHQQRVSTSPIRGQQRPALGDRRKSKLEVKMDEFRAVRSRASAVLAASNADRAAAGVCGGGGGHRNSSLAQGSLRHSHHSQSHRGSAYTQPVDAREELRKMRERGMNRRMSYADQAASRRAKDNAQKAAAQKEEAAKVAAGLDARLNDLANGTEGASLSGMAWLKILEIAFSDRKTFQKNVEMIFRKFDANGSGDIDIHKLGEAMLALGVRLTPKQLKAFRDDIDVDGDGSVSISEFNLAVQVRLKAAQNANHPDMVDTEEAWKKLVGFASMTGSRGKSWKVAIGTMFSDIDVEGSGEVGKPRHTRHFAKNKTFTCCLAFGFTATYLFCLAIRYGLFRAWLCVYWR